MPSALVIPILWFAAWNVAALLAFALETASYYLIFGRYYRFGPALRRQVWRTNVPLDTADSALMHALMNSKLAWRRQVQGQTVFYNTRKGAWRMSMWPRIVFVLEADAHTQTSTINCEVRPCLSLLLFAPPWFFVPGLALVAGAVILLSIAAGYVGLWFWELSLPEARQIRTDLSAIGVRACERCGYDIRSTPDRCPECGEIPAAAITVPPVPPPAERRH
jgi:hypothetical protein